jgi:hypothetical protein
MNNTIVNFMGVLGQFIKDVPNLENSLGKIKVWNLMNARKDKSNVLEKEHCARRNRCLNK